MTPIIKQILAEFIPSEDDTDVTGDEFTQSVTDRVITYPDGSQHKWDEDGNEFWLDSNGELHSDTGPAAIYGSGAMIWFKHGQYHRDDGPAMVLPDGTEYWYQNGQLHRDNGPAIMRNGDEEYWVRGKRVPAYTGRYRGEAMPRWLCSRAVLAACAA